MPTANGPTSTRVILKKIGKQGWATIPIICIQGVT